MIPLHAVEMGAAHYFPKTLSGVYRDELISSGQPLLGGPRVRIVPWSYTDYADYSQRTGDKGPRRLINGKPWAPSRHFKRRGWIVNALGGNDVYRVYHSGNWWRRTSLEGPGYMPTGLANYRVLHPDWDYWIGANTLNRLNTEVLIKAGKRQVNYGESLGEARETVSMLAKSVSTAVKALLAAKRGQWSRVPEILGIPSRKIKDGSAFSQGWLAYNYGWKPFMSDIYDSWQLLQKGFALKEPLVFSAVRNLSDKINLVNSSNRDYLVRGEGETIATVKVFYRVSDASLNRLNQLGLINPLEIAWALQPYSFVVDWFLPVGNVLEALSARMGIDFVDGYYGVRRTSRAVVRTSFTASTYVPEQREFQAQTDFFSYERRPMASLPLPAAYLKSPLSTSHLTSAIALLSQLRR